VVRAMAADPVPALLTDTLAFMFETRQVPHSIQHALSIPEIQKDYDSVWDGLPKMFTGNAP
jgi:homogentisate 1,2-dioxygenase